MLDFCFGTVCIANHLIGYFTSIADVNATNTTEVPIATGVTADTPTIDSDIDERTTGMTTEDGTERTTSPTLYFTTDSNTKVTTDSTTEGANSGEMASANPGTEMTASDNPGTQMTTQDSTEVRTHSGIEMRTTTYHTSGSLISCISVLL